ncbi:MAG: sugar ABC transporter ATP-binding protein [Candidatus Bathyarchaeia archaeon]
MVEVYLSTEGIVKTFPGVKALDNVSIELKMGRITALVGENGAGKSTLVKIISGVYQSDKGRIFVRGKEVNYRNSKEALLEHKIACVHQENTLIPEMTVVENFFLEIENRFYKWGLLSYPAMKKELKSFLKDININNIDIDLKAKYLKPNEIKLIEFAKSLYYNPNLLILDEVTAPLAEDEVKLVFNHMEHLKNSGKAVLFISHRLAEILRISDEVIILREGKVIKSLTGKEIERDQIISMMIGVDIKSHEYFPPKATKVSDKKILEIRNLKGNGVDVSFEVFEGEILALAGLGGQGMSQVLRMIYGILPREYGEFYLNGKRVKIRNPRDAIRCGIIYVSENRELEELFPNLSVKENISIPLFDRCNKAGVIIGSKLSKYVKDIIKSFSIKAPSLDVPITQLSGGNKQKVIIGRYICKEPKVLLLANPTEGLDIATKIEVYKILRNLANRGIGVVVLLSELSEVVNLPDRVLIMHSGRIIKELKKNEITEENILRGYFKEL